MAESWYAEAGKWKRRNRTSINPGSGGSAELSFMPAVQFHAVWDRTGSAFGATHTDILTKFKAMGVKAVRIDTSWRAWEPTQGNFVARPYNGKLEDTLTWLGDNNMKALVTVNESPVWATSNGTLRRLPDDPASMAGIGEYLPTYLSSYGSTVLGIEVWNEPNLSDFDDLGPRPNHYLDCLVVFHTAAKASAGSAVPIVFGATEAISVVPLGQAPSSPRNHFISYCYDRMNNTYDGLRPYDVMAVHCYPGNESPAVASTGTQYWRLRHMDYLVARMAQENDDRPIFMTEMGYSAHSNSMIEAAAQPPWQVGVTDAEQATLVSDFYQYVVDNYPQVKMVTCYNDWERGDASTASTYSARHQYGFGILKYADRATTKPIYGALTTKFTSINGGP